MTFDTATTKSGTPLRKGRSVHIEADIPIDTDEKQDEHQTLPSLNISSRPRRIKTLF